MSVIGKCPDCGFSIYEGCVSHACEKRDTGTIVVEETYDDGRKSTMWLPPMMSTYYGVLPQEPIVPLEPWTPENDGD